MIPGRRQFLEPTSNPNHCHPERSLAIRCASRQTKSKDPYHPNIVRSDKRGSHCGASSACLLGLIALLAPAQAQVSRNFPDKKSGITSPDRRYIVQNVDHDDGYILLLKDNNTGKTRQIYEYTRGASVVWSPDSRHFAIDDGAGSNYTETKILSVDDGVAEIDVQKEIRNKARNVPGGHHEYFYVAYWIDARRVVVYHWGYGEEDPGWFCNCYVYWLNGPVHKCVRQPKDSDSECQRAIP